MIDDIRIPTVIIVFLLFFAFCAVFALIVVEDDDKGANWVTILGSALFATIMALVADWFVR